MNQTWLVEKANETNTFQDSPKESSFIYGKPRVTKYSRARLERYLFSVENQASDASEG